MSSAPPAGAPEPASEPVADSASGGPAGASRPPEPQRRPYDPERGLRGIMSATLILEAISVLLSIPVAANTGGGAGPIGVTVICLVALLLVLACRIVARPYAIGVIVGLQALVIACWFVTPALGVMGLVFLVAWGVILWFRAEFRRRLAAGTLPGPPQAGGP